VPNTTNSRYKKKINGLRHITRELTAVRVEMGGNGTMLARSRMTHLDELP
jgi:hypothetical protein